MCRPTTLLIGGVDDVTKPVRERLRMRAAEIDDVAELLIMSVSGRRQLVGSAAVCRSPSLSVCRVHRSTLLPATDGLVCDDTDRHRTDHPRSK